MHEIAELREWLESRFDRMDSKLDGLKDQHAGLATRVGVIEAQCRGTCSRLGDLEDRLGAAHEKIASARIELARSAGVGAASGGVIAGLIELVRRMAGG